MTHDRRLWPVGVTLGIVILAATAVAQKLEVKAERDEKADFTAIKTYAFLAPAPMVTNVAPGAKGNPNLTQEVMGPHIAAAVERELTERGLVKASEETADVHVVYFAALTTGLSQTYLGEYYGYVTGWGSPIAPGLAPNTENTAYQKGTIVVDVIQRAAKRGIWHGSIQARIEQVRKLEERVKLVDQAMDRLFERFPIKPRK
jgi:hypothetical protein